MGAVTLALTISRTVDGAEKFDRIEASADTYEAAPADAVGRVPDGWARSSIRVERG